MSSIFTINYMIMIQCKCVVAPAICCTILDLWQLHGTSNSCGFLYHLAETEQSGSGNLISICFQTKQKISEWMYLEKQPGYLFVCFFPPKSHTSSSLQNPTLADLSVKHFP